MLKLMIYLYVKSIFLFVKLIYYINIQVVEHFLKYIFFFVRILLGIFLEIGELIEKLKQRIIFECQQ